MRSCERHGAGTENGKNYTLMDIAYWFHDLPHLKFTFHMIDNTIFNFLETHYIRSIVFFGVLSLFACLIVLIIYLIFSIAVLFVNSDKKHSDDNQKNKKGIKKEKQIKNIPIVWKILLFVIAILCILALIIGSYGVWKVYSGLGSLKNTTRSAINWLEAVKEDLREADAINSINVKDLFEKLRNSIISLGLFPNLLSKFLSVFDTMIAFVDSINEEVLKTNIPLYNISQIDIEFIYRDIDRYGNMGCIALLVIVFSLATIALLFTFGFCNLYLLAVFTVIAIMGIIFNALLMSVGFSASVWWSDFCVDAKPFIKKELNEDVLYYFWVECPLTDEPSRYTKILAKAEVVVNKLKNTYEKVFKAILKLIDMYCNTTNRIVRFGLNILRFVVSDIEIPQNMSITCPPKARSDITKTLGKIKSRMVSYTHLLNTLANFADCRRINRDFYNALESICGQINPGFVIIFFTSLFSLFCFFLIVFIATYSLSKTPLKQKIQNKIHTKEKKKIKK